MDWNEKQDSTDYSLLLVAFPELEGTPFLTWLRSTLRFFFAPLRRGVENLLVDTTDAMSHVWRTFH